MTNLVPPEERFDLRAHTQRVYSLDFSPTGDLLASGSADRAVVLWEMTGRTQVRRFTGFQGPVKSVAFSPDVRWLATGDWSAGGLHIWDVNSGDLVATPDHDIGPLGAYEVAINGVGFSPDGQYFAAAGSGLALWKVTYRSAGQGRPAFERLMQLTSVRTAKPLSGETKVKAFGFVSWISRTSKRFPSAEIRHVTEWERCGRTRTASM